MAGLSPEFLHLPWGSFVEHFLCGCYVSFLGGCLGVTAKMGPLDRSENCAGLSGLDDRLMIHFLLETEVAAGLLLVGLEAVVIVVDVVDVVVLVVESLVVVVVAMVVEGLVELLSTWWIYICCIIEWRVWGQLSKLGSWLWWHTLFMSNHSNLLICLFLVLMCCALLFCLWTKCM